MVFQHATATHKMWRSRREGRVLYSESKRIGSCVLAKDMNGFWKLCFDSIYVILFRFLLFSGSISWMERLESSSIVRPPGRTVTSSGEANCAAHTLVRRWVDLVDGQGGIVDGVPVPHKQKVVHSCPFHLPACIHPNPNLIKQWPFHEAFLNYTIFIHFHFHQFSSIFIHFHPFSWSQNRVQGKYSFWRLHKLEVSDPRDLSFHQCRTQIGALDFRWSLWIRPGDLNKGKTQAEQLGFVKRWHDDPYLDYLARWSFQGVLGEASCRESGCIWFFAVVHIGSQGWQRQPSTQSTACLAWQKSGCCFQTLKLGNTMTLSLHQLHWVPSTHSQPKVTNTVTLCAEHVQRGPNHSKDSCF